MNSQMSIARFFGGLKIDGIPFIVMPPMYDLVRNDIIKAYTNLGRDKIIRLIKDGNSIEMIKNLSKQKQETTIDTQLNLF